MNKTVLAVAAMVCVTAVACAYVLRGPSSPVVGPGPTPAFASDIQQASKGVPCEVLLPLKVMHEQMATTGQILSRPFEWREAANRLWNYRFGTNETGFVDAAPELSLVLIDEFYRRFPDDKAVIPKAEAIEYYRDVAEAL